MIKLLSIRIFGQVQGVVFRGSAKEIADKLDLYGFAQNQPNKSIYIEVEGEEKDLNQFLAWCKKGPNFAKVSKIEVSVGKPKKFTQFLII